MKPIILILLSISLIGCTTGSKTKTNLNYYSNTISYNNIQPEPEPEVVIYKEPEPVVIYKEKIVPVETIKYKTIYRNVPPQDATMADLGGEIGKKLLRKMRAAYNEN
jgi:hypothetical protein